jgi:hypothetical protein
MTTPFNSHQLKEMMDTKDARRSLFAIIGDDGKHRVVFSDIAYKYQVESATKFLQSRRRQEKERLEEHLVSDEKAIAARKIQRDKTAEERGGWSYDILSRPKTEPGVDTWSRLLLWLG